MRVDLLGCRVTLTGLTDPPPILADLLRGDDVPVTAHATVDAAAGSSPEDLLAEVTAAVVRNSPLHCMHAGVVGTGDGALAIPGRSGLGKTTLTTALLVAGHPILSDEVLAVDRTSGVAHPFARPLALSAQSAGLLGVGDVDDQLLDPRTLGRVAPPAPVRHLVLAQRRPGPTEISVARRGDAVAELVRRSFNHYLEPDASFRSVVALVRGSTVWRVSYSDAVDAAAGISRQLSEPR